MVQIVSKFGSSEVGDVVTLKSGGPDMTVIGFEGPEPVTPVGPALGLSLTEAEPVARVAWVTSDGVAHIGRFPIASLVVKKSDKPKDAPVV